MTKTKQIKHFTNKTQYSCSFGKNPLHCSYVRKNLKIEMILIIE